ncbi:FkbM family methyltransferase [Candidatus Micrarchaeota archaeon]|nr:FkbM family methyltransferase [Candidatus Micrarchaeota archaeon]
MLKNTLRRIKLKWLLLLNGFRLEGRWLIKGDKRFEIRGDDFLRNYVQMMSIIRLYPYFVSRNGKVECGAVHFDGNYGEAKVNGISMRFYVKGDDFGDFSSVNFYSKPEIVSKIGTKGAEIYGYLKERDIMENDTVFDCGSYYGHFALYAAKKARKGHVYCFEPDPENLKVLEKNIRLNNLNNVTIVPKVLSAKDGYVRFRADGTGAARIARPSDRKVIDVPSISLENFCKEMKIQKVDFIKMDVEGAEIDIVRCSESFIMESCGFFAIASYHIVDGKETANELESIFRRMNFETNTDFPLHKTTYAMNKRFASNPGKRR